MTPGSQPGPLPLPLARDPALCPVLHGNLLNTELYISRRAERWEVVHNVRHNDYPPITAGTVPTMGWWPVLVFCVSLFIQFCLVALVCLVTLVLFCFSWLVGFAFKLPASVLIYVTLIYVALILFSFVF